MNKTAADQLVGLLRDTIVALVRGEEPDLTARQLAVFLTCYLEAEAQTVRGLAAALNISKPAITRALDRLGSFELIRRKTDPLDRRSVLVQRTAKGNTFVRDLTRIMRDVAGSAGDEIGGNLPRTPPRGRGSTLNG